MIRRRQDEDDPGRVDHQEHQQDRRCPRERAIDKRREAHEDPDQPGHQADGRSAIFNIKTSDPERDEHRKRVAVARIELREAQHRLALASVNVYPFTWSPEIDAAVSELSRVMVAYRTTVRASNRASRDWRQVQP
ncbi:hypothetical protein ACL02O_14765 [Micromonospora sp. MS34]|uniref:hypothetical protein n=1 Tax=Micromonospora sp. MS34 TaxID=3385971 RepID=UPI0039A284D2